MVGSATEEAARGAVKEAAQEAVEETTQEAVRKAAQEADQGAVYRAVKEAVQEAAQVAAMVATRKAAHEAAQGAVCHAARKAAQEAAHTAALEAGKEVAKWCEWGRLGEGGQTGACGRRTLKTNRHKRRGWQDRDETKAWPCEREPGGKIGGQGRDKSEKGKAVRRAVKEELNRWEKEWPEKDGPEQPDRKGARPS